MAPKPPGCSDRPGKAVALLGITLLRGPDMAPKPPGCSDRPGKAVALLGITLHGAPTWPSPALLFIRSAVIAPNYHRL